MGNCSLWQNAGTGERNGNTLFRECSLVPLSDAAQFRTRPETGLGYNHITGLGLLPNDGLVNHPARFHQSLPSHKEQQ